MHYTSQSLARVDTNYGGSQTNSPDECYASFFDEVKRNQAQASSQTMLDSHRSMQFASGVTYAEVQQNTQGQTVQIYSIGAYKCEQK